MTILVFVSSAPEKICNSTEIIKLNEVVYYVKEHVAYLMPAKRKTCFAARMPCYKHNKIIKVDICLSTSNTKINFINNFISRTDMKFSFRKI